MVNLLSRHRDSGLRSLHLIPALSAKRQLGLCHALAIDRRNGFDHTRHRNGFDNRDLDLQLIPGKYRLQKTHSGTSEEENGAGIIECSAFLLSTLAKQNDCSLGHTLNNECPWHNCHSRKVA